MLGRRLKGSRVITPQNQDACLSSHGFSSRLEILLELKPLLVHILNSWSEQGEDLWCRKHRNFLARRRGGSRNLATGSISSRTRVNDSCSATAIVTLVTYGGGVEKAADRSGAGFEIKHVFSQPARGTGLGFCFYSLAGIFFDQSNLDDARVVNNAYCLGHGMNMQI